MTTINTSRNHVYALEPMPQDRWVKTVIGTRCLSVQHIDQYQQAVQWATSMAVRVITTVSNQDKAELFLVR